MFGKLPLDKRYLVNGKQEILTILTPSRLQKVEQSLAMSREQFPLFAAYISKKKWYHLVRSNGYKAQIV